MAKINATFKPVEFDGFGKSDVNSTEFERFKSEAGSNYFVLLTKINYRIHTDAINENLGPAELSK